MASLRDLPAVIRQVGLVRFAKKIWHEINDDNLFTWASALAYSWLFSIFPFFLVLLALIPLLRYEWRVEAHQQINSAIDQLPRDASGTIKEYIEPRIKQFLFQDDRKFGIKSLLSVGLLVAIWAASGGMAMTMAAMDRAYDVPRSRPIYTQRPLAVMLTLIVAALILAIVVLVPVGTVVTRYVTTHTDRILAQTGLKEAPKDPKAKPADVSATAPSTAAATQWVLDNPAKKERTFILLIVLFQVVRYGLAAMFMFWVVALVYHFGPNVKQKFRLLSPGAVFTVGTWALLAMLFRTYVDRFGNYGATYGAVGGVIILLFFFYIDALVLLIGAEINAEVDCAIRESTCAPGRLPLAETKDTRPGPDTP